MLDQTDGVEQRITKKIAALEVKALLERNIITSVLFMVLIIVLYVAAGWAKTAVGGMIIGLLAFLMIRDYQKKAYLNDKYFLPKSKLENVQQALNKATEESNKTK